MRYLSLYGKDGFRTFAGLLSGRLAYAPDSIPKIDPEILTERSFERRLESIVAPYIDYHPKGQSVYPLISSNLGSIHKVAVNCSLWRPLNHLSLLGELLVAGLLESFLPEEMNKTLQYFSFQEDKGLSFQQAFSLEKKQIFTFNTEKPNNTAHTEYITVNDYEEYMYNNKNTLLLDHHNIFRVLGHMATIIHGLYCTEEKRYRFYNDPVSIVIPADNMEYVLAAYYLSKSNFPIKTIYGISQHHRMVHLFLEKGEFKISDKTSYHFLEISLDRMLFELARGSSEKVVLWKKELQKGSFRVDTTALKSLNSIFKSQFVSKNFIENHREFFEKDLSLAPTQIATFAYQLSQDVKEHVLAFDICDPNL